MRKILPITIASALILSSCGNKAIVDETEKAAPKAVKITTVKKDNFSEQLKLVGKVSPGMETPITPLVAGAIKKIDAQVGQKVKAGEVLASIDLSTSVYSSSFNNANTAYNNSLNAYTYTQESTQKDLEAARIQLENAESARENTYSTTEKQLSIAQTQLDNIRKSRNNTVSTTKESLKNAELLLLNSQTNLENFKRNSQENLNGLYENLKVAISSSITSVDGGLTQADMILGVSNRNKLYNDAYEIFLGAKEPSTKLAAERAYNVAKIAYDDLLSTTFTNDRVGIENKNTKALDVLDKSVAAYEKLIVVLNATMTSASLPQAQLDLMMATASKYQGGLLQSQGQLTTLKNTLNTTKTSIDTNLISLQNSVTISETQLSNIKAGNNSQLDNISGNETLTQAQLENTIITVKASRDNVDNALKIAKANYASIQAKLDAQKVQAKSQLDAAKGGKDLAGIQLNNTSIIAPFDGVITARNVEVGTSASPGVPAFMIGSNDQVLIKMDISGDNVGFMKIGQPVKVSRGDSQYDGIVTLVSPAADPATKMFKVEIGFNKKPENLKFGDFADVYISKEKSKDKVILVPFSSVISLGQGEYSVYVVDKDSKIHSKPVKIGEQNSTQIEITSGLEEGDRIVTSGALNLQDGDLVEEIR